jgi:glycosyltransferase involved in cell wall biosynthesis
MTQPRITIVTPCYNSERFLEETILSVLDQGWENLEYIIVDGGSTDGTVDIIRKYEKHLAAWISEPDQGMYDAVNKGFALGTGEIFAWINSDDTYLPGSLQVAADVFIQQPDVQWITGKTVYTDTDSERVKDWPLLMYHQRDLAVGYYGVCMHYVQQHGCFWRQSLWQYAHSIPCELKYAGDYWLWVKFAEIAPLVSVNYEMATFRRHDEQLHKVGNKYWEEMLSIYKGKRFTKTLRQVFRQLARRSDWDVRFFNWVRRMPAYCWLDPSSLNIFQRTYRSRIKDAVKK